MGRAVDAWVDGELDAEAAGMIALHVRICWDCSSAAETTRLVKASLRAHRDHEPPRLAAARLRRFAERLAQV